MITPAHGQAVSIAAGRYTAGLIDVFGDGCNEEYSVVFDWPGGSGETVVEVTSTFIRLVEVSAGDCSEFDPEEFAGTETFSRSIFVAPSGSSGDDEVAELFNTSPPLPAGFSFFVRYDD